MKRTITLYHGGNKNEDPEMYPVYWLTDSKTMALNYAFNNDWPCVYKVTIDTSKLSFENHVEHYDKYFDNAYCLGLRYLTPIINIEPLTEEELQSLTESSLKNIFRNFVNETVNQTSTDQKLQALFDYLNQEPESDVKGMLKNRDDSALKQKAYNYFEPKSILHDVWIIHFTNLEGYEDIPLNGFKYGENTLDKLAYTGGNIWSKKEGEYGFGLLLNDPYIDNYDLGYGDCALVFKTDGVLAHHKIDGDDEVIFLNNNIKSNYYKLIFEEGYDDVPTGWSYNGKIYPTLREALNQIGKS